MTKIDWENELEMNPTLLTFKVLIGCICGHKFEYIYDSDPLKPNFPVCDTCGREFSINYDIALVEELGPVNGVGT